MKLKLDIVEVDQAEFCEFLIQYLPANTKLVQFDEIFFRNLVNDLAIETDIEKANRIIQLLYAQHILYDEWPIYTRQYDNWKAVMAIEFAKWKRSIMVPDEALHDVYAI